jgi:hypothetical protein
MSNDKNIIWPVNWIRTNMNVAIWYALSTEGPTPEDYDALKAGMENAGVSDYTVDDLTICGRYSVEWTTAEDERDGTPPEQMDGGLGSPIYEMQNIADGGLITDRKIWIYSGESMTKMIPPNSGLYWMDDKQLAHAGAKPGSPADVYVGDKELYFDGMWRVPVGV